MKRLYIVMAAMVLLLPLHAARKTKQQPSDREYWCSLAYKIAQPVLENMAKGELQKNMKTEFSPSFDNRDRSVVWRPIRMRSTPTRPTISAGARQGRIWSTPPISPSRFSGLGTCCGCRSTR